MSMKKYFAIAMAVLGALSCTKETVSKNDDGTDPQVGGLRITVSTAEAISRVSAGTEAEGKLPVLWQAGDQIAVIQDKGSASQKVSIFQLVGAGGTASGEFEYVSGDASTELIKDIVYPASAVDGSIPKAQSYVEGSFDPAAALMTFHSDAGVAPSAGFTLSHAASFVCLQLKGKSGQSIASIAAKVGDANYTLTCATPVALGETALPFYIAVPAASCDAEFVVTLSGGSTVKKVSLGKEFQTGKLHRFPECLVIDRGDLFDGGLVFLTNYDSNWVKIVSLDQGSLAFSTETTFQGTEVNPDEGEANTAILQALPTYATAYPGPKWCTDHGEGWYMPSRKEIVGLINNVWGYAASEIIGIGLDRFQNLLQYFGGDSLTEGKSYMTCCEHQTDGTKVFTVLMSTKKTAAAYAKTGSRPVRAVKKVTI